MKDAAGLHFVSLQLGRIGTSLEPALARFQKHRFFFLLVVLETQTLASLDE
jgi:hypothetical protein